MPRLLPSPGKLYKAYFKNTLTYYFAESIKLKEEKRNRSTCCSPSISKFKNTLAYYFADLVTVKPLRDSRFAPQPWQTLQSILTNSSLLLCRITNHKKEKRTRSRSCPALSKFKKHSSLLLCRVNNPKKSFFDIENINTMGTCY